MPDAATGTVRYSRDGGIGRLVIDRPPVNVLDLATLEALQAALAKAAADRKLKVLALSGAGRAFSAGVDAADHTADRVGRMIELFHGALRRLMALEVPVIAVVRGAIARRGLRTGPGLRHGARARRPPAGPARGFQLAVFPPFAAALLPRLIGRQRAMDLVLTGRPLRADEALRMGLVSRVFGSAEFEPGTEAVLTGLAAQSGPAMRLAKRAVAEGADLAFTPALERAEAIYLHDLMKLRDAHEGLAAFMAKRPPVWEESA